MTQTALERSIADLTLPYTDEERRTLSRVDFGRLPRHVAIIMDGNGRWARRQARERLFGHQVARRTVRTIVETARDLGLSVLTLFAFSAENWRRPVAEVTGLMQLLETTLREEIEDLHKNGIKIRFLGDPTPLPASVRAEFLRCMEMTHHNRGMVLALAINYGGRQDVVQACRAVARRVASGQLSPEAIEPGTIEENLWTAGLPEPELLIRTAGELRISNFLLWQLAYTEIHVSKVCWPEFSRMDLLLAILDFQERVRRFGGL